MFVLPPANDEDRTSSIPHNSLSLTFLIHTSPFVSHVRVSESFKRARTVVRVLTFSGTNSFSPADSFTLVTFIIITITTGGSLLLFRNVT